MASSESVDFSDLYCTLYMNVEGLLQEQAEAIARSVGESVMQLGVHISNGRIEWRLGPITNRERAHDHLLGSRRHMQERYWWYHPSRLGFCFYRYPRVEMPSRHHILEVADRAYRALQACGEYTRSEEYLTTLLCERFESRAEVIALTKLYVDLVE